MANKNYRGLPYREENFDPVGLNFLVLEAQVDNRHHNRDSHQSSVRHHLSAQQNVCGNGRHRYAVYLYTRSAYARYIDIIDDAIVRYT